MPTISHIKCSNCGLFNTNKEYCDTCNALISHQKKRETKEVEVNEKEIKEAITALEKQNFADKMRQHPFFIAKILGWILHSVWILLNIIGGLVAWFVAMVAAG